MGQCGQAKRGDFFVSRDMNSDVAAESAFSQWNEVHESFNLLVQGPKTTSRAYHDQREESGSSCKAVRVQAFVLPPACSSSQQHVPTSELVQPCQQGVLSVESQQSHPR